MSTNLTLTVIMTDTDSHLQLFYFLRNRIFIIPSLFARHFDLVVKNMLGQHEAKCNMIKRCKTEKQIARIISVCCVDIPAG